MNDFKAKISVQILAGIILAMILGIAGLIMGMYIGGNYGCLPIINSIFGTRGYESCGSFGGLLGLIGGAVLGVFVFSRLPIKNYQRVMWVLVIFLTLPILFYSFSILTGSNYSGSAGAFFWGLLKIFSIPVLFSILAAWIFNRKTLH